MRFVRWLETVFGLTGPVDRTTYAASGILLAAFKYAVEAGVCGSLTGRFLTPAAFVSPSFGSRQELLAAAPPWLGWALFVWSVPFIWIALSMSVRRAAAAGLSPWLGTAVLVPFVNLAALAALAVLPDRVATAGLREPTTGLGSSGALRGPGPWPTIRGLLAALAVGLLVLCVGVYSFSHYGAVLFFGTPLVMGMVAGFLSNKPLPRTTMATLRVGAAAMLLAGGVLLAFAFEGLICLVMAAPIVMPTAMAGALLGKWIAESTTAGTAQILPVILALPILAGAESVVTTLPEHEVLTCVDIDAPPATVWRHVVSFPDMPEPEDWFFRCGIACPMRARIEGEGVGAVRHCEFSTGDFVEPITVWDEPTRLAFDVREQPDPMVELSPWRHVHPPHLHDGSLRSRRGEFRLIPLPDGTTRLEGRTWYTFDMHPHGYWTAWSHLSIHRIHRRVLDHIKGLAEADETAFRASGASRVPAPS